MATVGRSLRTAWVSYLRVSTPAQAERALSVPGQRRAIEAYAAQHGQIIVREYVEAGRSGRNTNRKEFRQMLEDVLRPGSDIAVIVVHQTSRFSRDATQARVVKAKLRRQGVRVIAVCQETNDDPFGQLIEGLFECIDQYESEVNGLRTSAAMREAVRHGFFPGAMAPYGYRKIGVTTETGAARHVLVPEEHEASVVRELYQLYVAEVGAMSVARVLNQRGHWYRRGKMWSKDLVLRVLDESAISGTYFWGRLDGRTRTQQPRSKWLALTVEPIIAPDLYQLARRIRADREPRRRPGRPPSPTMMLARIVRCAKCGASCRLELSGKRIEGGVYKYRYYNCTRACRMGPEACDGGRLRAEVLERIVAEHVADAICTKARSEQLITALGRTALRDEFGSVPPAASRSQVQAAWRALLLGDGRLMRNYLLQVVDRIEVQDNRIMVVAKQAYRDAAAGTHGVENLGGSPATLRRVAPAALRRVRAPEDGPR